jgi:hypothetical protein
VIFAKSIRVLRILDSATVKDTAVTFLTSMTIQCIGTLLISIRVLQTPTISSVNSYPKDLFWAFVKSGALYSLTTLLAVISLFHFPTATPVFSAVLGQLSVGLLFNLNEDISIYISTLGACPNDDYLKRMLENFTHTSHAA